MQQCLTLSNFMQTSAKGKKSAKEEVAPDVKAAIAAVDAAVNKLPNIEVDLMSEEGFAQGGGAEVEPPNAGSKVYGPDNVFHAVPNLCSDAAYIISAEQTRTKIWPGLSSRSESSFVYMNTDFWDRSEFRGHALCQKTGQDPCASSVLPHAYKNACE